VFALSRILDQLTWPIATSKGWTDWQKYPKNWQSIRKQQPEPLENKTCHAFPGKGVRLQSALPRAKGFNSTQIRARRPGPTVREWHTCPLLEHWPTLQPLPISQSGGCTLLRCSFPAVLQTVWEWHWHVPTVTRTAWTWTLANLNSPAAAYFSIGWLYVAT
jgi:hypothetical protein